MKTNMSHQKREKRSRVSVVIGRFRYNFFISLSEDIDGSWSARITSLCVYRCTTKSSSMQKAIYSNTVTTTTRFIWTAKLQIKIKSTKPEQSKKTGRTRHTKAWGPPRHVTDPVESLSSPGFREKSHWVGQFPTGSAYFRLDLFNKNMANCRKWGVFYYFFVIPSPKVASL